MSVCKKIVKFLNQTVIKIRKKILSPAVLIRLIDYLIILLHSRTNDVNDNSNYYKY